MRRSLFGEIIATMINLFSVGISVLIFQKIPNIHLACHGCQISLRRETCQQTSGPILTILEVLLHQNKRDGYPDGALSHTAHTWEFIIPHEI